MRALCSLALVVFVFFHAAAHSVSAAEYTVGDSTGWVLRYDYPNWATDKSFVVGDKLLFNYAGAQHNVVEVDASGYDSCSDDGAISTDNSGHTTIALSTPGTHYFICSIPGHCAAGMKLQVSVAGSSSSPAPPTSNSTTSTATSGGSRSSAMEQEVLLHVGVVVLLKLVGF